MTPICSEYVLDGKMRPYLDTVEMVKYIMSNISRIIMVIAALGVNEDPDWTAHTLRCPIRILVVSKSI